MVQLYVLQLWICRLHVLISLQQVQEVSAGVFSFSHDLIHELNYVPLYIFLVDAFKVYVFPLGYQLFLMNFVEDQDVVSTQNVLNGCFIAPHCVFSCHGDSDREMET